MICIDRFTRTEWQVYSEQAHLICFEKSKPAEWDRIDFALVVRTEDTLMGYLTCREYDHETVYWQFGGAFPGTKDSALAWQGYKAFVEYCQLKYKRVTTLIENTNTAMLKMAMKVGFRIVGIRNFKGDILLEHLLEFESVPIPGGI